MTQDYNQQVLSLVPRHSKSATVTMDWLANGTIYPPRHGIHITPLINGEAAFAAVHDAIQRAEKSVEIISWGFDPAMRFKPGGDRIGELLDQRGRFGVKVRTLIWKNILANLKENTVIGDGIGGSGGTAIGSGMTKGKPASDKELRSLELRLQVHRHELDKLRAGELPYCNSEYRFRQREQELQSAIARMEAELDGYNRFGGSGGPKRSPEEQEFTRNWFRRVHNGWMQNVEFRTRDFDSTVSLCPSFLGALKIDSDRINLLARLLDGEAPDITWKQVLLLCLFPSHHQKMVLVDYEDPSLAVGFVMGHNMHRNSWDTSAHLFSDKEAGRSPGFGPWQDLSLKVCGPVLHDLNHNFCAAWDRETPWVKRWFSDGLQQQRQSIKPGHFKPAGSSQAQICRTQPQEGAETSILEIYRKAIGNVRNYIYFENQYFRYANFGRQLGELAARYAAAGRKQDLYLFVVTNTPDDAGFSSSTYEMLQTLGQERLMPQAQRDLVGKMLRKRSRLAYRQAKLHSDPYIRRSQLNEIDALEREIVELEAKGVTPEVEERWAACLRNTFPSWPSPNPGKMTTRSPTPSRICPASRWPSPPSLPALRSPDIPCLRGSGPTSATSTSTPSCWWWTTCSACSAPPTSIPAACMATPSWGWRHPTPSWSGSGARSCGSCTPTTRSMTVRDAAMPNRTSTGGTW